MPIHQLIALAAMPYAGKQLKAGDPFEAETRDARVLVAINKAKYAEIEESPKPPPPPPPKPPIPKPPAPPTAKSTAVGAMTSRSYKTRDMKPE